MKGFTLTRQIPVDEEFDLVVAGGGPAGAAAAISAGRLGLKVLLVEATGCAGGMGTSGLVTAFDPMANGERNLVGGIMLELVETLYERGFLKPGIDPACWRLDYHVWTPFHPEGLKIVLDEKLTAAGVEVRFFSKVVDCHLERPGRLAGAVVHNVEGFRYVPARAFVDATGDAVLADLAGAPCRKAGRDSPRIMPASLTSIFAGIDWENPGFKQRGVLHWEAVKEGYFSQRDFHCPGMSQIGRALGYLNGGHLFDLDALRVRDLSDGAMLGRRLAQEFLRFYRERVPGAEHIEHVATAALIGVRESRRVVGEYELSRDDYVARRQFPDQVGVFNKFIDIHPYDCSDEEYARFRAKRDEDRIGEGECFGIPYGAIVPRDFENLWVAGRCISCDVPMQGCIRVMPAAGMTGQAAGTAAAQCLRTGQTARDLDTAALVKTLRDAGAYLPQKTLAPAMTKAGE